MTALKLISPQQEWAAWNAAQLEEYQPRIVPESERERYSANTSLRQFYNDCGPRWDPIGRKRTRARGTLQKERQALNRWERFTQPDNWPAGVDWPGPSLAVIGGVSREWFESLWDRMLRGGLAAATVKATRNHLMAIIKHAVAVMAIQRAAQSRTMETEHETPRTRIYTPDEVNRAMEALRADPLLQAAYWLGLHVGPRTVDLFLIKWTDFVKDARGRRLLDFQSRKTGKLQAVPIANCVWEVLDALPRSGPYVFPGYGNPNAVDPEKTYQSRVRNTLVKQLLRRAGIEVKKPWQVCRATCNERYESHRPGVGSFILGHSLGGVNARSYRQPTEAVHEAVKTLPPYDQMERQRRLF